MVHTIFALFLASGVPHVSAKGIDEDSRGIFTALMAHYAKEFRGSPSLCVDPVVPRGDFGPWKTGVRAPDFRDPEANAALLIAEPRNDLRLPRSIVPRRYRFSAKDDCVDNFSFHAPAISGDYAFVFARWSEVEDGDGGGTIDLIALHRNGTKWTVQAKQTLLFMN